MTADERVQAIVRCGFGEREARFLVGVMLHSGVCLSRQYCKYVGIVRGEKSQGFFRELLSRRVATVCQTAHRHTYLYHVHGKRLYRAIGEAENRHRRPVTLARAIERLMLLDALLSDRERLWLATGREKVEHFVQATSLPPERLPRLVFGAAPTPSVRYFPDKLPIGYSPGDGSHVFLYVVTRVDPMEFRGFLHRHAELLRSLPRWEVRLLVPPHLATISSGYERAAEEEFAMPLAPAEAHDLRWYFEQRRRVDRGQPAEDVLRFEALRRGFAAQRHRALYRAWQRDGDARIYDATSPVLQSALADMGGQVTREILSHDYLYLSPLVGTA